MLTSYSAPPTAGPSVNPIPQNVSRTPNTVVVFSRNVFAVRSKIAALTIPHSSSNIILTPIILASISIPKYLCLYKHLGAYISKTTYIIQRSAHRRTKCQTNATKRLQNTVVVLSRNVFAVSAELTI